MQGLVELDIARFGRLAGGVYIKQDETISSLPEVGFSKVISWYSRLYKIQIPCLN